MVHLATLAEAERVPETVAMTLGLRDQPGRLASEMLVDVLRTRALLLVLDNCEHVLTACGALAYRLLRGCPELTILMTSREPIGIPDETVWRVPSLSIPDDQPHAGIEHIAQSESVQLFGQRAEAAAPGFKLTPKNAQVVGHICRQLEGVPLAIELAAARVGVLSLGQIDDRLSDALRLLTGGRHMVPPHQETLRAALDWSYALLTIGEQQVLAQLSVFVGGWSVEAAEEICWVDGVAPSPVLDVVTRLVDKSLILVEPSIDGPNRFRLLETVRQYASERLQESGAAETMRVRHAQLQLRLAEQAETGLTGAGQQAWLECLEREHDNLRAALRWAVERDALIDGLRLATGLARFWNIRGQLAEGRAWIEMLLARDVGSVPAALRANAESSAGQLSFAQGHWADALVHYRASIALHDLCGDLQGVAAGLCDLGSVAQARGDCESALGLYERSLGLHRQLRNRQGIATCLNEIAEVARHRGQYERAEALGEEALGLQRELGDTLGIAYSLNELASVVRHQGDYRRATAACEEALELQRELRDNRGMAYSLGNLGLTALAQRDHEAAAMLFEQALALQCDVGDARGIGIELEHMARLAHASGDPGQAQVLAEKALSIFAELGDNRGVAMALGGLATSAALVGQADRAARLFAATGALRDAIDSPLDRAERAAQEMTITNVRRSLGGGAFARAWDAGRRLPVHEAVAEALSNRKRAPAGAVQAVAHHYRPPERELNVRRVARDNVPLE
jgi:predicted ATPase